MVSWRRKFAYVAVRLCSRQASVPAQVLGTASEPPVTLRPLEEELSSCLASEVPAVGASNIITSTMVQCSRYSYDIIYLEYTFKCSGKLFSLTWNTTYTLCPDSAAVLRQ